MATLYWHTGLINMQLLFREFSSQMVDIGEAYYMMYIYIIYIYIYICVCVYVYTYVRNILMYL